MYEKKSKEKNLIFFHQDILETTLRMENLIKRGDNQGILFLNHGTFLGFQKKTREASP